jgi:hypothetical protein
VVGRFPLIVAALTALAARTALAEPQDDAGHDDATPAAAPRHGGMIVGTVLWAGNPNRSDCETHAFEMEGHRGVNGGLANVVVVAEPVSPETQRQFRDHPRQTDASEPDIFFWNADALTRVAVPDAPFRFSNDSKAPAHILFSRGRVVIKELALARDETKTIELPEGLVRAVDPHTRISGWVFVTPYPSKVSEGNCSFVLDDLPAGRYRLRGWHPSEGRQSRTVNVRDDAKGRVPTPLIYGREARAR